MNNDDPKKTNSSNDRDVAANIIRDNLNRIYESENAPLADAEKEIRTKQNPNLKERQVHAEPGSPSHDMTEQWKKYHSSWTTYYQQYYERYYLSQLHKNKQIKADQNITSHQPGIIGSKKSLDDDIEDTAVNELRDKLLVTVKERAVQVKKSRHYGPIMTAVAFAFVFLFLQYNQFLVATVQAYVSPGNIDSQNIIIDPSNSIKVGPEPKLIIPKINVEAPMVYGANPLDNTQVENELRKGVVHYPIASAASSPGQNGATTILGHSSMDVFDDGQYKFVFVQLSKLEKGDNLYINYQGVRYTYSVTKKEIIDPSEIAKVTPTNQSIPSVILITCEPPGTAQKRLLVFADQISPDPSKGKKADAPKQSVSTQTIRGDSPSALERLFGIR